MISTYRAEEYRRVGHVSATRQRSARRFLAVTGIFRFASRLKVGDRIFYAGLPIQLASVELVDDHIKFNTTDEPDTYRLLRASEEVVMV